MTVQKFTTFDDLKAINRTTTVHTTSNLKKHDDFEKVIVKIRFIKVQQNKPFESKP